MLCCTISIFGRNLSTFKHTGYDLKRICFSQLRMKDGMLSVMLNPHICCCFFRMEKSPIETTSQHSLSQWLCRIHNGINNMLGKESFDCARVDERWKDGWNDGSCG